MIITIQGQTIHYTEYGAGLPLIILHGLYLDSISMLRAIENTKIELMGFRRIYIDIPGMGQSPRHSLSNNTDNMLDLLCETIKELVHQHTFIVMGYSYGGYLTQGIAKRFKGQVIGEVLICPVVVPNMQFRKKAVIVNQDIHEGFFKKLDEKHQKELLETMVVINERTVNRSEADFSRAIALADREFVKELYEMNYASNFIEGEQSIHEHKALIFLGYQDNVVGYLDMLDRLNRYPKATVNLLTNASHSFFLEQPTQFEYIMNSWLSQYKENTSRKNYIS